MKLTEQQAKTVRQALQECDRFIAKESPRNANLRPKDMQQHLDFCIQHRTKLIAALADNSSDPLPMMR